MAHPILIKLAATAATDKRTWKVIGVILAAVLTPLLLVMVMFMKVTEMNMEQNKKAVDYCFSDEQIPYTLSTEQRDFISLTRNGLELLTDEIDQSGCSLDSREVKAVFICVYNELWYTEVEIQHKEFIECFIKMEHDERVYNSNIDEVFDNIYLLYPELDSDIDYAESVRQLIKYISERGYQ